MTARGPHDRRPPDDAGREDPLDGLRDAFASLPLPEATPALEDSDAATRAAVDWTRRAWRALLAPASDASVLHDRAARRRVASSADDRPATVHPFPSLARVVPLRWARAAAAAVVFATLAWLLSPADDPTAGAPLVDGRGTPRVDDATPAPRLARDDADAPARRPIPGFREATPPDGLVAATTDHLEVSSGPVRLVLVTNRPGLQPGLPPDLP